MGQYSPGRHRHNWHCTLLPLQVPSQVKQRPAHSTGTRQRSSDYNTSGLHPLPSRCYTLRPRAHGLNIPLCDLNLYNTHSRLTGFTVSLALFWAHTYKSFLPIRCLLEQVSPLMSDWIALCPISSCLVLRLPFPPPWGGDTTSPKKKKSGGGCLCTTGSFRPPPSGCFNASIKENCKSRALRTWALDALTHDNPFRILDFFFHCLLPTSLLFDAPVEEEKRGEDYTREQGWRLLWVLLVGFLRSSGFLCIT